MNLFSALNLALYLGLIPVILVAAVVVALRERQRLGVRASRMLVSGAVVLLAAHAFTALRPLLSNTILQSGGIPIISVGDAVAGLTLVQLAVQAIGLCLIMAGAFAPRPQVTSNGLVAPSE